MFVESFERFFNIVVPIRCALCAAHGTHICKRCLSRLERMPLLRRAARRTGSPPVAALGAYTGELRAAILGLKFRQRSLAARRLGMVLGAKLKTTADVIVPVPLHAQRLRERGFNQAAAIAAGIATVMKTAMCERVLVRHRATRPQTSLALSDRAGNVVGAFGLGQGFSSLCGAHVLLIDDVVTTGATMTACAEIARKAGAASVSGAALAITV